MAKRKRYSCKWARMDFVYVLYGCNIENSVIVTGHWESASSFRLYSILLWWFSVSLAFLSHFPFRCIALRFSSNDVLCEWEPGILHFRMCFINWNDWSLSTCREYSYLNTQDGHNTNRITWIIWERLQCGNSNHTCSQPMTRRRKLFSLCFLLIQLLSEWNHF